VDSDEWDLANTMLILAADTSGKNGSIALAIGNADGSCDVVEVVALQGGTFSAQLVPQIAALLSKHHFRKDEIGGFAVASGPGSFTGLRVGLAAIKALAEVMQKPIAAVSLLEAVARAGGNVGSNAPERLAALDAGRGELYVAAYDARQQKTVWERLLNQDEFLAEAKNRVVITPDSRTTDLVRAAGLSVQQVDFPRADGIAKLALRRILAGETVAPDTLEANYLRRSDAEIFSIPRASQNAQTRS
jgi:tRNA threonylcarbamoyladenosine biosynthesis protein TsaB